MHSRESLLTALAEAAELEHSITCQYLFAAFSLKTHPEEGDVSWPALERIRGWKAELLRIARQEMAHHGMVSNLLMALGGAPSFHPSGFPHPARHCWPYTTFELMPFCDAALERFACYERMHGPPQGSAPGRPPGSGDQPSIQALYQRIRAGIEHLARTRGALLIGPLEHQISNPELNIRPGQFDIELCRVTNPASALALIDRICDHDHHQVIQTIQRELDQLRQAEPGVAPARPVVTSPRVDEHPDHPGGTVLRHPHTRAAAALFNAAYEAMVLMLTRLYGRTSETDGEAQGLIRIAFFPLMTMVIRPLGEVPTLMPASEDQGQPATAGAGFERPFARPLAPHTRSAWIVLHERLRDTAAAGEHLARTIEPLGEPWARRVAPRLGLLAENLACIAQRFEQHMGLRQEYVRHMLTRMR